MFKEEKYNEKVGLLASDMRTKYLAFLFCG